MDENKRFVFFFEHDNINRLLANVTNIGSFQRPDIKLSFTKKVGSAFGENGINYDNPKLDKHTFISSNIEFTYHHDGSFLRKLPKNDPPYKYFNPSGVGSRQQPLDKVESVVLLSAIEVQNYNLCDDYVINENTKSLGVNKNTLFNGEPFIAIIYVKNKEFIINRLSCELFYSNFIDNFSQKLDLGIYIQRISKKCPEKIYSNELKRTIYTSVSNTITFCDNDKGIIPFFPLVTDRSLHKSILESGATGVINIVLK